MAEGHTAKSVCPEMSRGGKPPHNRLQLQRHRRRLLPQDSSKDDCISSDNAAKQHASCADTDHNG
jgi:hypothetical protein